ncbi:MAG: thiazole synthase [Candidatus Omnitrophica bacterium]|nr:thiazole synthase [Candidatus Omnitrophota bacterium]
MSDLGLKNPENIKDTSFSLGGRNFTNRFLLGTGKFKNKKELSASIKASGSQIVTVALRRIDVERHEENILEYIPDNVTLLINTSGARNAEEAIRLARLAKEAGYGNWIKIEVINDSKYLLPDNQETIKATETLAKEGFIVLPYMNPDMYAARDLISAGAAAVMPLGSLIGSNQGLQTKEFIKILINEINAPIIVDAGIGAPSQAAEAMEMGADAVLVNTAVATAQHPPLIAKAFAMAITAGRLSFLSKLPPVSEKANASSPLTGFLYNNK